MAQANVEPLHAEAAAGDADEERLVARARHERAVLDQSAQVASIELAPLASLDRADEVDLLTRGLIATADEIELYAAVTVPERAHELSVTEALVGKQSLDRGAHERLDRAAGEQRPRLANVPVDDVAAATLERRDARADEAKPEAQRR